MRNKPPRDKLTELERVEIVEMAKATLFEEQGREALRYLKDVRKLDNKTIRKFELGYVPSWVRNPFDDPHELAGRITIPIRNQYGDIVAFSSRDWRENAHNRGFWHESFEKSNYLYGLNVAKDAIIRNRKVVLVEGEIDVMSMHRLGFNMTVGILGSALSAYQISLLGRYCQEFFLAFDGDKAGALTMKKALEIYQAKRLDAIELKFIPVRFPAPAEIGCPDKKKVDADLFANVKGKEGFIKLFKDARETSSELSVELLQD